MSHTFTTFIERDDDELEVCVTYEVSRYYPATLTQPAEGGDCEIISAEFVGIDAASAPSPLTVGEHDALQVICEGRASEDEMEAAADYADYKYQQYRDRMMFEIRELA